MSSKFKPSTPDEAASIAAHTCAVLRSMRGDRSRSNLTTTYKHWVKWAGDNHVALPIREHMSWAFRECGEAMPKADLTDKSKAMQGDHQ